MEAPRGTPPVTPLRRARRMQRIPIKLMAAALAVSPETVRRWEQGISVPRYPEAVADYLGVTVETVLFERRLKG